MSGLHPRQDRALAVCLYGFDQLTSLDDYRALLATHDRVLGLVQSGILFPGVDGIGPEGKEVSFLASVVIVARRQSVRHEFQTERTF